MRTFCNTLFQDLETSKFTSAREALIPSVSSMHCRAEQARGIHKDSPAYFQALESIRAQATAERPSTAIRAGLPLFLIHDFNRLITVRKQCVLSATRYSKT